MPNKAYINIYQDNEKGCEEEFRSKGVLATDLHGLLGKKPRLSKGPNGMDAIYYPQIKEIGDRQSAISYR